MPFLRSAALLAVRSSLVLVPCIALIFGMRAAAGFGSGTIWAMANMWAINQLTRSTVTAKRPGKWKLALLWIIKIPLLYIIAVVLIVNPLGSPVGFLCGFSFWFLLLVISAMRSAY